VALQSAGQRRQARTGDPGGAFEAMIMKTSSEICSLTDSG
jgi:hypothetical protein